MPGLQSEECSAILKPHPDPSEPAAEIPGFPFASIIGVSFHLEISA